jgi:hypothetical protein
MTADEPRAEPLLLRHLVPVLVGGVVTLLLTFVTDNTLTAHEVLPAAPSIASSRPTLLLMVAYRALFAVLGCHLAARLAPAGEPRMRYAVGLGFVLMALNIGAAVSLRGQVPVWYSLTGIALTIPCAIVGGGTAARAMAKQSGHSNKPL